MAVKCIMPDEYAVNIRSDKKGWHSYRMDSVTVNLRESEKIDEVSALPTPWARMEFVQMAFKKWGGMPAHEAGLTLEEKEIINYTFDLLELVFYQNHYTKQLEIKHVPPFDEGNYFAKATINFFNYPPPSLIKLKNDDGTTTLLGSTSPYTLVYPAYHRIAVSFPLGEQRKLFAKGENTVVLTGKRPEKFLQYLKHLSRVLPGNGHPTEDFKTALSNALGNNIREIASDAIEDFLLSGVEDRILNPFKVRFEGDSSFTFSKLRASAALFASDFFYTGNRLVIGTFDTNSRVLIKEFPIVLKTASYDVGNLSRNVLPNTIIKHDWLHETDFFTQKLLKLPYELNGDSFYIGITDQTLNSKFAPPVANVYFENPRHWDENLLPLFETNLTIKNEYGKQRASMDITLANEQQVRVSKLYTPEEVNNDLAESGWAVKVFPNYYISNYDTLIDEKDRQSFVKNSIGEFPYFVSLLDESGSLTLPIQSSLRFYDVKNEVIGIAGEQVRKKKTYSSFLNAVINYKTTVVPRRIAATLLIGAKKENYYVNFIPRLGGKRYNHSEEFGIRIGFDFGTTNSVIAYHITGAKNETQIADFKQLKQLTTYLAPDEKLKILPETYSSFYARYFFEQDSYREVFRSLISYSKGSNNFADWVNFSVLLNNDIQDADNTQNEMRSEFKWDINNPLFASQAGLWIGHFISSSLLLLKYLLLESDKELNFNDVQLAWFYPLAFSENQLLRIRAIWKTESPKVFPKLTKQPREIDESVAPFVNSPYYSPSNTNKILNIDVGGGTTDICLLQGTTALIKLSLPLAGRNIFGDLYNKGKEPLFHNKNVWIKTRPEVTIAKKPEDSHEHFIKLSDEDKKGIILASAPVIWFFGFCILNYVKIVLDKHKPILDKDKTPQDFYPDEIRFSGNGSKVFEALMSDGQDYNKSLKDKQHSFNKFVALIFKKDISIEFSKKLKEDTVIGGVKLLVTDGKVSQLPFLSDSELSGENVNDKMYNAPVKLLKNDNAIMISPSEGSYLLKEFLQDFKKMLTDNADLFDLLFQSLYGEERKRLEKYIDGLIEANNLSKLQNYIIGGMNNAGVSIGQLNSSLLMYELQGIINEMTREL